MGNYETMQAYLGHVAALDWEAAQAYFGEDVVAHVGGHNVLSGTYEGKAAFMGYLGRATAMTDSLELVPHDLLAGDDHAVVLATINSVRGDKTMSYNRVVVYHLADDKITELWLIDEDQQAVDDFLS
jgi:ketosteroid isomerase-like protein